MSSSTINYTTISSDYEEPSDTGSPGVIFYRYDGLSMHLVDPYAQLSPDYVPEPEYPEYLVPSDAEAPMEDQPLPDDVSPTSLSPGYVVDSDPEEDLYEDHKEDPADYPANGGDDDNDESSDDDDDDDDEEEEEEEEHLAPADSTALPVVDHVSSAKDIEAFKTDKSAPTLVPLPRRRMAKMSIRLLTPMSVTAEALIAEYASALTPPSPPLSPLSPLSSPLPQIPSPPIPLPSPPTNSPTYVKAPLGYRAARIRWGAASPSTHHPSEIPSPPMLLPSITHRDDLPEAGILLRKIACFTAPTGRFEVEESLSATVARQAGHTLAHKVDYGFIDTMDASICDYESRAMTAVGVVNERVMDLTNSRRIRDEDRLMAHIQHEHDMFRDLIRAAEKMPPKKRTTTTTTTTTLMTDAQLKALIAQGVVDALQKLKLTEPAKMVTTSMIQELVAEGRNKLLTVTHEVACRITWKELKKMMTNKYYLRGEIKKLKIKLWNLKVKGTDVLSYNQHFQELALMCDRMSPEESDEVEKYVCGLPDMIHGSVIASKPKTMQDAIEFATELMDQKICTLAKRQAENK
ncbi:putative reverse transcriptase domain-containing protein [Tanacetum coccineum]|uniref:Reverse transcriptase domain-containing protein n=1 Tax=Tanacetum coccineum TaxID=301880 RepID=A0ABQ4WNL7_9ASTR